MKEFLGLFTPVHRYVLVGVFAFGAVLNVVIWLLVVKARGAGGHPSFATRNGIWHIGMLRGSYYPPEGRHLYPWIVACYLLGLGVLVCLAVLFLAWARPV
jgi:hypothetical protein